MSQDGVEVARYSDATDARDASRRLLSAGITPHVHRDGSEQVLTVPVVQAGAAAEVLEVEPPPLLPLAATVDDAPPASDPGDADDGLGDLVVDERGFVVVALADGAEEAHALSARLLEGGIPSERLSAFETGHANPMASAGDPVAVQVLEVDADRALGILGLDQLPRRLVAVAPVQPIAPGPEGAEATLTTPGVEAPASGPALRKRTEVEEVRPYLGGRLQLTRRQVRTMIALYVAALVLIPLGFFLMTRWVLTPDIETPELPGPSVDSVLSGPDTGWP